MPNEKDQWAAFDALGGRRHDKGFIKDMMEPPAKDRVTTVVDEAVNFDGPVRMRQAARIADSLAKVGYNQSDVLRIAKQLQRHYNYSDRDLVAEVAARMLKDTAVPSEIEDQKIVQKPPTVDAYEQKLTMAANAFRDVFDQIVREAPLANVGREIALAKTRVDEAQMWMERALRGGRRAGTWR